MFTVCNKSRGRCILWIIINFTAPPIPKFFFNDPNVFSTLRDLLYVYADVCNSRTLSVVRDTWYVKLFSHISQLII